VTVYALDSDAILCIYRHYVGGIASLSYIIILFAQPMFEVMIRSNLYFRAGHTSVWWNL